MTPRESAPFPTDDAAPSRAAHAAPDRSTLDRGTPEDPLDLLCVGVGPFGLGLACLADPLTDVRAAFLDAADGFDWHPGLLFEDATLQVPFLADLVTMADPTSRFSFLQWLKETGQLYPFYVRESFYPLRRDYNAYCRWAAERVRGVHWGHRVVGVTRAAGEGPWCVEVDAHGERHVWWARHLVVGTGTVARLPAQLSEVSGATVHAGEYLTRREDLVSREHVSVVGSGQSAAEVFLDLVTAPDGPAVDWITRSPRFYPMEYSKLSLELTSPDYLDHFRSLPEAERDRLNASQPQLHRGISDDTVDAIHEALYVRRGGDGDDASERELIALQPMLDAGVLEVVTSDDDNELLTFIDLATLIDEGEAMFDLEVAGCGDPTFLLEEFGEGQRRECGLINHSTVSLGRMWVR